MWWWNSQIEETPEDPSAEYTFTHIQARRRRGMQVRIAGIKNFWKALKGFLCDW